MDNNISDNNIDHNNILDEYLIPNSNTEKISLDNLSGLNANQLRIARNEIYARYGYVFGDEKLNSYFSSKGWYTPIGDDVTLNGIELYNLDIIKEAENA